MESKVNYRIVGIFTVFFLALFAGIVIWLGKFGYKNDYDYYRVLVTESVSGLNIEAAVKYRGVTVGSVQDIRINDENTELIELILKIKKGTPIKVRSAAMLKPQVITGLNFLDITPGENKDKLLKESSSDKLPVIKYAPSFLSKVDASIPSLMDNVQKIMLKIDTVLSERNIDELSKLLKNLRIATEKVSVAMDGANTMIDGSKELPAELKKSLIEIQKAAKSASDTANSLDGRIKKGDFDFKDEVKNLSEKTDRLIEKLGDVAAASNTMINDINKNPSAVIFDSSSIPAGPGEDR